MTSSPGALTDVYNEKLLAYQELDDFIEWEGKSERNIINRKYSAKSLRKEDHKDFRSQSLLELVTMI